jgi:hypothetical protein
MSTDYFQPNIRVHMGFDISTLSNHTFLSSNNWSENKKFVGWASGMWELCNVMQRVKQPTKIACKVFYKMAIIFEIQFLHVEIFSWIRLETFKIFPR